MDVLHALVLARAKKGRKGVSTVDNEAEVEALAGEQGRAGIEMES